ncbi:MAG: hypothetical protein JWO24_1885 [Rhodospirillales bacterium]|jgi:hypothetical protein|nr:hypothetical protein [Rhodospirillales bacterium]
MRAILLVAACAALISEPAVAQTKVDEAPAFEASPLIRPGSYAIQGTATDGASYEGALDLEKTGPQTWRIVWSIAGDVTIGVGLSVGGRLVCGYQEDGQVGAGFYEPGAYGRLIGRWTHGAQGGVGSEILLRR